jgi:TonB family protein
MIKTTLIVLAGLAVAALVRRQSAALRHWVLATALACGAIAPLAGPLLPEWRVTLPARAPSSSPRVDASLQFAAPGGAAVAPAVRPAQAAPVPSIWWWLRMLWIAGAVVSLLSLAIGAARLRWLAMRSQPLSDGAWLERARAISHAYGIDRPLVLLHSTHPSMLVTWGTRRPTILLPAQALSWSAERIHVVLAHELAHVRRRDWVVQLLAEIVRSVYWLNPVVWIACKALRRESELACDDVVLRLGGAAPTYATHLVALARDASRHTFARVPAQAMARPRTLERRVGAMLNSGLNRNRITRTTRGLSAAALICLSLAIAALGAGAQSFASFSGTVTDPSRAPIPNALVALSNTQSSASYQVRTDGSGRFEFVGLPPGAYSYKAEVMGFKANRGDISISGRNVRRDLTMEVGSLSETITIMSTPETRAQPPVEMAFQAKPSAPSVQECQPSASGGNIKAPHKIRNVPPTYPPNPDGTVEGVVILKARIAIDGTVDQVEEQRSPHPDLTRAATAAIEQWQFTPTLLNCVPIPVEMTATFNFTSR